NSKINVLPAPVGAWTTTSMPSRKAERACCCHRSGTVTRLSAGISARAEEKEGIEGGNVGRLKRLQSYKVTWGGDWTECFHISKIAVIGPEATELAERVVKYTDRLYILMSQNCAITKNNPVH